MVRSTLKNSAELLLIICVIVLISCLPLLLQSGSIEYFLKSINNSFYYLLHPQEIIIPYKEGLEIGLFDIFTSKYLNSVVIIVSSFIVSFICSIIFTFTFTMFTRKLKKAVDILLFFVQSMPDILIVLLAQLFFIWLFKSTGVSVGIYTFREDDIFLVPILCLSIIPTLHFFKYFSTSIEEEKTKEYYLFLQSKGLSERYVFFVHLFRNTVVTMISYSKNILLFMISSLLILEVVLNINGVMNFVRLYGIGDFRILMWVLIMIYIPAYIMIKLSEFVINKWIGYDVIHQEISNED